VLLQPLPWHQGQANQIAALMNWASQCHFLPAQQALPASKAGVQSSSSCCSDELHWRHVHGCWHDAVLPHSTHDLHIKHIPAAAAAAAAADNMRQQEYLNIVYKTRRCSKSFWSTARRHTAALQGDTWIRATGAARC
jgi:hypothetical protein